MPRARRPRDSSTRVSGDAAGTCRSTNGPTAAADGPATDPVISMLLATPVSFAIPVVAKEAVPFGLAGAVMVKPVTCLATPKLPVPQVVLVQVTFVPPPDTTGTQFLLFTSRE